jgi:hypothetical protein
VQTEMIVAQFCYDINSKRLLRTRLHNSYDSTFNVVMPLQAGGKFVKTAIQML